MNNRLRLSREHTFQAAYKGTKAVVDSLSFPLRAELKDAGVTVRCLMPEPPKQISAQRAEILEPRSGKARRDAGVSMPTSGRGALAFEIGSRTASRVPFRSCVERLRARDKMAMLHEPDWKAGFGREGDPLHRTRAVFLELNESKPIVLFELAKGWHT